MGHSIGEYAALVACSALSFEDALHLVIQRGKHMAECRAEQDTAMVAVIPRAPMEEFVAAVQSQEDLQVDIAAINSSKQVVLSGISKDIEIMIARLQALLVHWKEISNISLPFHSRFMRRARESISGVLEATSFCKFEGEFLSNVTGCPEPASRLPLLLARQITSTVLWQKAMKHALNTPGIVFVELGPRGVLGSFLLHEKADNSVISLAAELEAGRVTIDDGKFPLEKQIRRADRLAPAG